MGVLAYDKAIVPGKCADTQITIGLDHGIITQGNAFCDCYIIADRAVFAYFGLRRYTVIDLPSPLNRHYLQIIIVLQIHPVKF